ncbi:Ig-like domain-containing protein [Candidatus Omnitrophota bacterium]
MKREKQHIYTTMEFIATFFLLLSVALLTKDILGKLQYYLLFALISGFIFSWVIRNRKSVFLETIIGLGALGIFIWTVYQITHSSLFYKDVIGLCVKGGMIAVVLFSFYSSDASFLRCIQALTLPLFMCFPAITKAYHPIHLIFIGLYLISWVVIIKIKFYSFLVPEKRRKKTIYGTFLASVVFFLVSIFIAWFVFFNSNLGVIKNASFFMHETGGLGPQFKADEFGGQEDTLEKEYYKLEEDLLREIDNLLLLSESSQEKSKMIFLLSKILQDSPEAVEIRTSEPNLHDLLRRPGAGLEKAKGKPNTFTLTKYIDKKIIILLQRNQKAMAQELKKSIFDVGSCFSVLNKTNNVLQSESSEQITQYEKELITTIELSSLDAPTTQKLQTHAKQLSEWKKLQLDRLKEDYLSKTSPTQMERPKQKSNQASASQKSTSIEEKKLLTEEKKLLTEKKKLLAIKITPNKVTIPLGKSGQFTATGRYSDNSQADLTRFVNWVGSNDSIAKITQGKIDTFTTGDVTGYAVLDEIKSLDAFIRVTEPKLIAIIVSPNYSRITLEEKLSLKAKGRYSDSSHKEITSLVSWHASNAKIISIKQGNVQPLKTGTTKAYAQYNQIKSEPATIEIFFPAGWLILLGLLLVALVIAIAITILRLIVLNKINRLKYFIQNDPRRFIIGLYGNVKRVIGVFGLKYNNLTPYITYAGSVEERFRIENGLFLKLTDKYQEAKYSSHILLHSDASLVLEEYNKALKVIFSRYGNIRRFLRCMITLLCRLPLLIN